MARSCYLKIEIICYGNGYSLKTFFHYFILIIFSMGVAFLLKKCEMERDSESRIFRIAAPVNSQ